MKKTIMLIALMGLSTFFFAQDTIQSVSEDVLIENVPLTEFTLYADSLQKVLDQINSLSDIPGHAGEIISFYPKIKDGMVTFIKQVRKPDSAEDVSFLVELFADYAEVIGPLLLYFITLFYRIFKKNTAAILAASGKVFNFMRTRYFVAILSVLLTAVWAIFFREETSIWILVSFLLGTAFKGIGAAMVIEWIKEWILKILGKKEAAKA